MFHGNIGPLYPSVLTHFHGRQMFPFDYEMPYGAALVSWEKLIRALAEALQATSRGHAPSIAALFSMRRTNSVWRVMPLLEKIERRCARAVLREIASEDAASSSDRPAARRRASDASAGVRSKSWRTRSFSTSVLASGSRI